MNIAAASVANLAANLDSRDRAIREGSAREIFRRGYDIAERAIASWRGGSEIGQLISDEATVGIAVTRERFARIRAVLGNPPLADVPADQDAEEFEWNLANDVRLDILTTRTPNENGAIARFLAKFGEGIQQVEFRTRDIDEVTRLLSTRLNVKAVYPATRPGADGTRVNFFLATAGGRAKILIELVQHRT